jgi:hypothetical protein
MRDGKLNRLDAPKVVGIQGAVSPRLAKWGLPQRRGQVVKQRPHQVDCRRLLRLGEIDQRLAHVCIHQCMHDRPSCGSCPRDDRLKLLDLAHVRHDDHRHISGWELCQCGAYKLHAARTRPAGDDKDGRCWRRLCLADFFAHSIDFDGCCGQLPRSARSRGAQDGPAARPAP